jgi:flagellar hook-length control protein FliK
MADLLALAAALPGKGDGAARALDGAGANPAPAAAGASGVSVDLSPMAGTPGPGQAAMPVGGAAYAVRTPVGDPGFGADLSRQVVYLAKTGTQSAELTLQPPGLGPVSVAIQMNGLQASVAISASHEASRAALRDALPQLSALFQQSGLQLAGAHVGDGSERTPDRDGARRDATAWAGAVATPSPAPAAVLAPAGAGGARGLIDTFA